MSAMMMSCRMVTFPRTTQKEMRTVAAAYSPSKKLDRVSRISEESEPPAHIWTNPEADRRRKDLIYNLKFMSGSLACVPSMYH